jgi:hypothetical protein
VFNLQKAIDLAYLTDELFEGIAYPMQVSQVQSSLKKTCGTGFFLTARVLGQFAIFKEKGEVLVICV